MKNEIKIEIVSFFHGFRLFNVERSNFINQFLIRYALIRTTRKQKSLFVLTKEPLLFTETFINSGV